MADKCGRGVTVDIEAGKTLAKTVKDTIGVLAGSSMQKGTLLPGGLNQLGEVYH